MVGTSFGGKGGSIPYLSLPLYTVDILGYFVYVYDRFGDLPSEFYAISKEEIKKEQQAKQESAEKLGMIRTKAMRERDELRELRKYR